jgi:NitT/TauT family transport system permease protein
MTYHSALNALDSVDGKLIEMCDVYRVPMKKRILGLYLPTAAPYVLKESAAAVSFSLKLTVSAEILALTPISLGGMMQQAQTFVEMPTVFALTMVAVAVACLLEIGISALAAVVERGVR